MLNMTRCVCVAHSRFAFPSSFSISIVTSSGVSRISYTRMRLNIFVLCHSTCALSFRFYRRQHCHSVGMASISAYMRVTALCVMCFDFVQCSKLSITMSICNVISQQKIEPKKLRNQRQTSVTGAKELRKKTKHARIKTNIKCVAIKTNLMK